MTEKELDKWFNDIMNHPKLKRMSKKEREFVKVYWNTMDKEQKEGVCDIINELQ